MKYSRIIILFIILASLNDSGFAQDISLKASVSRNHITMDQQVQYSLEVSGKSMSLPDVTFPDFLDFYVLSGPNVSTNIQLINGTMTSSKIYTFFLQPKKEGQLSIGQAELQVKGQTVTSNQIVIKVDKSGIKPQQQNNKKNVKTSRDPNISGQDIFLKTQISKHKAYLGEQIIVEYRLYFRVNIRGYNVDKIPANAGFWSESFKIPAQPVIENEVINGINYNVATIHKLALFPTQSGELTLEPMRLTLEAVVKEKRRRRSLFDSFFDDPFGRTVQKSIASKPVTIKVIDLPKKNKPSSFNGTVGSYKFDLNVNKTETEVNEAITLKMKLRGAGNIKLIEPPKLQIPPDIEQYDPKINTQINKSGEYISGTKSIEYLLIPRIEGDFQIKRAEFSYFDPAQKKYKTITAGPVNLTIKPGRGRTAAVPGNAAALKRQEVSLLGEDIRYIKPYEVFRRLGYRPYLSGLFWLVVLSALIIFGFFVLFNEHQVQLLGDERLARNRRAGKIANRQLAQAKKLVNTKNQSEFYKAISAALRGFVQDKLNIDLTDFSARNVQRSLNAKGIDRESVDSYLKILEESDFRQFANIAASADEQKSFFEKAKEVLTKLEKWI